MSDLALKHAYLFSHGMGFFLFEKDFSIDDHDSFEVKIKKKNLNDVLNSLMLFTSAGQITSIAYSSNIKETIKEKYLNPQNDDYYNYVINNLRGQRLKFSLLNQEQITEGNLIGGESYNSSFKRKKNVVEKFFLIYDNGIISQLPYSLINNISIVDSNVTRDVDKALEVNSTQDEEESVLKIFYDSSQINKQNTALIGYAIPISLWKINYRIKIDSSNSIAYVDSFSIISNPLTDDWIDTEVSLITGRPVSFIYNLNRTDKLERSIVSPKNVSAIDPAILESNVSDLDSQTSNTSFQSREDESVQSLDEYKKDLDDVKTSLIKQSDLNLLRYNLVSNISKLVKSNIENDFERLPMKEVFSKIMTSEYDFSRMNLGQEYTFHVKGAKTIKAKENAIIPLFSNLKLPCSKLLYLEYKGTMDNPYTSIELFNEADYPFESGPCVIFEDETTPVGEAILPTCFTSQSRIISYSREPRVTIQKINLQTSESTKKFTFLKKPLSIIEEFTKYQIITFKIRSSLDLENINENPPKLLILDYQHPENWDVVKEELGDVKSKVLEKGYRFTIPLKDQKLFSVSIKFQNKTSNRTEIQAISKTYFSLFNDKISDQDIKERFEENYRLIDELDGIKAKVQKLTEEKHSIVRLIARIRNNLGAIPESSTNKIRNSFVLKLNKFEDDLEKIDKELQSLSDQQTKILQQLEALR